MKTKIRSNMKKLQCTFPNAHIASLPNNVLASDSFNKVSCYEYLRGCVDKNHTIISNFVKKYGYSANPSVIRWIYQCK